MLASCLRGSVGTPTAQPPFWLYHNVICGVARGVLTFQGFPGGVSGKEPACQCRGCESEGPIPGSERFPGGGHGNPPQCPYLQNPMDSGAWWATVHGVTRVGCNLVTWPPPFTFTPTPAPPGTVAAVPLYSQCRTRD